MNGNAKRVAYLAVLTALGAVLLLLINVIPSGRLGLMLIVSFPVCAALMLYGPGWAFGTFAVTAVLGLLLFPGAASIVYAAFFGYYPIAKSLFERIHRKWLSWALKFVLYAAAFAVCWALARELFSGAVSILPWYAVLLIGAAAFAVYDWCYSLAICFYIERIARYVS